MKPHELTKRLTKSVKAHVSFITIKKQYKHK